MGFYSIIKENSKGYLVLGNIHNSSLLISKLDSFLNMEPPCFYKSKTKFSIMDIDTNFENSGFSQWELYLKTGSFSLNIEDTSFNLLKICPMGKNTFYSFMAPEKK